MDAQTLQANKAFGHPVVLSIRARATWHKVQSQNFLNNSPKSMHQHEKEAQELEKTATFIEREAMARVGLITGKFTAVCTGFRKESGRYIQVQNAQGWRNFWSEAEQVDAEN
jgi:hypothetical protein